mgnify:CR=1 FL=1
MKPGMKILKQLSQPVPLQKGQLRLVYVIPFLLIFHVIEAVTSSHRVVNLSNMSKQLLKFGFEYKVEVSMTRQENFHGFLNALIVVDPPTFINLD